MNEEKAWWWKVKWWNPLTILRQMKVGDIVELPSGSSGFIEKFGQGIWTPWEEVEPENANWIFVEGNWYRDSDLFFKDEGELMRREWINGEGYMKRVYTEGIERRAV